jgi:hypothetical protein
VGPNEFALRADIDFSGSYLARALQSQYEPLLFNDSTAPPPTPTIEASSTASSPSMTSLDSRVVLGHSDVMSCYAEDVTREAERSIAAIKATIRKQHPHVLTIIHPCIMVPVISLIQLCYDMI